MRILYLDFDGVINDESDDYRQRWARVDRGETSEAALLQPRLVERVERICQATGAVIVISSMWRKWHNLKALIAMLRQQGLAKTEVIGTLGPLKMTEVDSAYSRSNKIKRDILRQEAVRVVVLDDMGLLLCEDDGLLFIRTDPLVGLTEEDVEEAIGYLNGGDNY